MQNNLRGKNRARGKRNFPLEKMRLNKGQEFQGNNFNLHQDDKGGWNYHVTPGKFPHIMGGYWGIAPSPKVKSKTSRQKKE